MHRLFLGLGFLLGALAVVAGAFGTHLLSGRISVANLEIFQTASRYHLAHAIVVAVVGLAAARWPEAGWGGPGSLLVLGTLIFSGSLYVLALTDARWWGAVTPVGGVLLIGGWMWAAWIAFTRV